MKRANKGFTLIELLVAVAILAVVTAIAIPAYNNYVRESRLGAMRMNLDTLRIAVEAYRLDSPSSTYGTTKEYNKTAIAASYGWIPEGDNNAYDYVVRVTATTQYRICAGQLPQASDTWVRCDKTPGAFGCTEGTKGSTAKTASQACQ